MGIGRPSLGLLGASVVPLRLRSDVQLHNGVIHRGKATFLKLSIPAKCEPPANRTAATARISAAMCIRERVLGADPSSCGDADAFLYRVTI